MSKKVAIILFNLGGPDAPEAIKPFLFNLFFDKNIIGAPLPIRYLIAKLISGRRNKEATAIYDLIGGKSPILENTQAQATALDGVLNQGSTEYRSFVSMRYWHPFSEDVIIDVQAYAPDEIILLPLYPQFSTTTVKSSLEDWRNRAVKAGMTVPLKSIGCYPTDPGFVNANVDLILPRLKEAAASGPVQLLLSAHGLPKKIVDKGDPYPLQVEMTAAAIIDGLRQQADCPDFDPIVCYQSRVGPLEWIGPATDVVIEEAGAAKKAVVVAPIAFVSDHSETLVEIDMEFRELAAHAGVPSFHTVPAVADHPVFINGLADLVRQIEDKSYQCPVPADKACPGAFCVKTYM